MTIENVKHFIFNKYYNWYVNLIYRAKERILAEYTEKHHIIPKSLGGSNQRDNIVLLTAREHYVAHLCLVRCTHGQAYTKMLHAIINFKRGWNTQKIEYTNIKMNSHVFAALKEKRAAILSSTMTGENNPFYGRKHSSETRQQIGKMGKGRVSPNKGKQFGQEFREKARQRQLGIKRSEVTKQKMSENSRMKDPIEREKQRDKLKKFWANPENRQRMLDARGKK